MFFLERKEPYAMPNILGNHSFPVHSWRWRQVAVCAEREPLERMIPPSKEKEYRIIDNERKKTP